MELLEHQKGESAKAVERYVKMTMKICGAEKISVRETVRHGNSIIFCSITTHFFASSPPPPIKIDVYREREEQNNTTTRPP